MLHPVETIGVLRWTDIAAAEPRVVQNAAVGVTVIANDSPLRTPSLQDSYIILAVIVEDDLRRNDSDEVQHPTAADRADISDIPGIDSVLCPALGGDVIGKIDMRGI